MGVLEDKAQDALTKIGNAHSKLAEMRKPCLMALASETLGEDTFEWTQEQKQALIGYYQTLKAELQAIIDAFP